MSDEFPAGIFLLLVLAAVVFVLVLRAVSINGERRGRCEARGGVWANEGIKYRDSTLYCIAPPTGISEQ